MLSVKPSLSLLWCLLGVLSLPSGSVSLDPAKATHSHHGQGTVLHKALLDKGKPQFAHKNIPVYILESDQPASDSKRPMHGWETQRNWLLSQMDDTGRKDTGKYYQTECLVELCVEKDKDFLFAANLMADSLGETDRRNDMIELFDPVNSSTNNLMPPRNPWLTLDYRCKPETSKNLKARFYIDRYEITDSGNRGGFVFLPPNLTLAGDYLRLVDHPGTSILWSPSLSANTFLGWCSAVKKVHAP